METEKTGEENKAETYTIKINCCGKIMDASDGGFNGEDVKHFVCLTCGHFINIIDGELDEEELENIKGDC